MTDLLLAPPLPGTSPDFDAPPEDDGRGEPVSSWRLLWRRYAKSRLGVVGLAVLAGFYALALGAPFFAPYDSGYRNIHRVHAPPQMPRVYDAQGFHWPFIYDLKMESTHNGLLREYRYDTSRRIPVTLFATGQEYRIAGLIPCKLRLLGAEGSDWNLLGTDGRGGDLLSRLIYGGRVSLTVGLVGVLASLVLGTVIGTVSGYFGGIVDSIIQRVIELLLVFPTIPLWMALASALPVDWSPLRVYFGIVSILSLVGWGALARQVRGLVLSSRELDYVNAARCFGGSHLYLIFRHLIPSCTGHLIVIATLAVPGMILGETALSFLGLGIKPPMTSWGALLRDAQHLRAMAEHPCLLAPVLPVLAVVVAFNFVGDALRDALDPNRHTQ